MSIMHACGHSQELCNDISAGWHMRFQFHFHTILSKFSHAHKATMMCVKRNHNGNWLIRLPDFRHKRDVNSKWFAHNEVDPIWMCQPR